MADTPLTLQPGHLARLNRMLSWFERNFGMLDSRLRNKTQRQPQILTPGGTRFAWATTTGDVAIDDATFTVTDIVPCDGSTWDGDDPLTVQNSPLNYEIDSGVTCLIKYIAEPDGSGDYAWYPDDSACPE